MYADMNLVYATDPQVREATYLDLETVPGTYPIRLQGLKANADGLYLLSDLTSRLRQVLE
jgi:glucose-1-phosphatase